jgi:hypothetical protein
VGATPLASGHDPDARRRLLDGDQAVVQKEIEAVVDRWIRRSLERRRLTQAEWDDFEDQMAIGRKIGMTLLEQLRDPVSGHDRDMKAWPFCEAGNRACRSR